MHARRIPRRSRHGIDNAPTCNAEHSMRTREALCEVVRLTWYARLLLSTAMIRRRHVVVGVRSLLLAALVLLASVVTGCTDSPVGRKCDIGEQTPNPLDVVVASQSLDCVSRTCLRYPPKRALPPGSDPPETNIGLCTAECSSSDDCDRVPESPCVLGFTCGVAVTAGPYCCRKFCICKDYVVLPASGELDVPKGCDATEPKNACCNLEGRRGSTNPDYRLCQ
jgi:hypothetical protein